MIHMYITTEALGRLTRTKFIELCDKFETQVTVTGSNYKLTSTDPSNFFFIGIAISKFHK